MIQRLLAKEIPQHWELIKYCLVQVNEVDEQGRQQEAIEMLHELLSNVAQCFVRLNKERVITAVAITNLTVNKITGKTRLWLSCLYSFEKTNSSRWARDWAVLFRFANDEGCTHICFRSRNPRVWQLAEMLGAEEKHRTFSVKIAA